MLAAHPYEKPAYDVVELADPGLGETGTGRIGDVAPTTLRRVRRDGRRGAARDRARRARRRATRTGPYAGSRCAAGPATSCSTRCADRRRRLRHQRPAAPPGGEFLEKDGPALVDVAHWAAEWTWLPVVEARLRAALGDTVETRVSTICTDPWQHRI